MKKIRLTIVLLCSTGIFAPQLAKAQLSGLRIMQQVYDNPKGTDTHGELTMILTNKQGEKRVRNLVQYTKDFNDVEKKIMFFMAPADVRGTSFMNWSYTDGRDDDQWIYLPALKRIKRISSEGKGDYFMGSDFTYDDLGGRHPDEDNHTLLREETVNGHPCWVVESTPKVPDYMYSKTITWVMKNSKMGIKREFYDGRGRLLKILNINKFDQIEGFWTILETEMVNVQKEHSTRMQMNNIKINQGIPDRKFTERSMMLGE